MKRALLIVTLALLSPAVLYAATTTKPRSTKTTTSATPKKATPKPAPQPAANTTAETAASNEAKTALDKANREYRDIVEKLAKEFEASSDYVAAAEAAKEAAAKLESAKNVVSERVKATPEYKAAAAHEAAETAKMSALRDNNGTDEEIQAQAKVVFDAGAVGGKLIGDALAADADVLPLQKAYTEAAGKVGKLKADFQASLAEKSEVKTARKAADDAQKKYDDALTRLAAAQKK